MDDPDRSGASDAARVFLGVGSNLDDRLRHLRHGVRALARWIRIRRISSIYESGAVGFTDQPDFLNAVVEGETGLGPEELLARALEIEEERDRRRPFPGAPRTLDIDLLYHGTRTLETPELTLPHPERLERSFVLRPLAEVAPGWTDPVTGRTVAYEWRIRRERLPAVIRLASGEGLLPGLCAGDDGTEERAERGSESAGGAGGGGST